MKKNIRILSNKNLKNDLKKSILKVLLGTLGLLLIPLIAIFFTDEMKWDIFDFIVAGILIAGTGIIYVFVTRLRRDFAYRAAFGVGLAASFIVVWANLAVGIVGSEDNPINLLFFGILLIGVIGAIISKFKPIGMSLTMFTMSLAQLLVASVLLLAGLSSLRELLLSSVFLISVWTISGVLFRKSIDEVNLS